MIKATINKTILLDFKTIKDRKSVFIKELAIMEVGSLTAESFLFKSPYIQPYKKCIRWDDGDIEYNELCNILDRFNRNSEFFVIGHSKKSMVKRIMPNLNIIDLNGGANITWNKLPIRHSYCNFINCNYNTCPKRNVLQLNLYFEKNDLILDENWD